MYKERKQPMVAGKIQCICGKWFVPKAPHKDATVPTTCSVECYLRK